VVAGRLPLHAIAPQIRGEAAPLLVTRNFESVARIAMGPTGTPLGAPSILRRLLFRRRHGALFLLRCPEASAGEPHQHDVLMPRLQLLERRHELVACVRTKRGRLAFEDDRPVCVSRRHDQSAF